MVWDFMLERTDGTLVFLHPSYRSSAVEAYVGWATKDHEIPRRGPGRSNGPGSYWGFKTKAITNKLKFKPNPGRGGKGKGEGKAKGDAQDHHQDATAST